MSDLWDDGCDPDERIVSSRDWGSRGDFTSADLHNTGREHDNYPTPQCSPSRPCSTGEFIDYEPISSADLDRQEALIESNRIAYALEDFSSRVMNILGGNVAGGMIRDEIGAIDLVFDDAHFVTESEMRQIAWELQSPISAPDDYTIRVH